MSEQPAPVIVPVYPINPDRGKGVRKAGLIVLWIGAGLLGVVGVLAIVMAMSSHANNPLMLIAVGVVYALPLLITGLILWLVGRGMVRDTAAKLAFMAQQAGGAR